MHEVDSKPGSGGSKLDSDDEGFLAFMTSSSLVFIGTNTSVVCGSFVGQSEEKFCAKLA